MTGWKERKEKRNRWMVDRAELLIGVYSGAPGGTEKTIEYARGLGREIILYDPKAVKAGSGSGTGKP